MIKRDLTILAIFVILGSLGLSGSAEAQGTASVQKSCQQAEFWVTSLEEIPKTYEEIASLPLSYRKAVYLRLSPAEQVRLWHRQWENALSHDELTDEQAAILLDSIQLVTADTLAVLRHREGWRYSQTLANMKALGVRAVEAFGKQEAGLLLANIGPIGFWEVKIRNKEAPAGLAKLDEACSCNGGSDFCPDGAGCGGDGDGCRGSRRGCGWFWVQECNGECLFVPDVNPH